MSLFLKNLTILNRSSSSNQSNLRKISTKNLTQNLSILSIVKLKNYQRIRSIHRIGSRDASTIAKIRDVSRPQDSEKSNTNDEEEEDDDDDLLTSLTKRRGGRTKRGIRKISPRAWLSSEEGLKFRDPVIGQTNWLGGDIPFPTNPWFKPVPPLSDSMRTKIYESFKKRVEGTHEEFSMIDDQSERRKSEQILIRQTSDQWGISKDRVAAIIRLKSMEEYWNLRSDEDKHEPSQSSSSSSSSSSSGRALQLNFERGMENVLGVEKDSISINSFEEDPTEFQNKRLRKKSNFFGTEFVPLDSPRLELNPSGTINESDRDDRSLDKKTFKHYREFDEPTEKRQVIGPDGLPRPSTCYVSKPEGKVPMVFTDVSRFPRQDKPMSKRRSKYFRQTPLFANFSPSPNLSSSSSSSLRRKDLNRDDQAFRNSRRSNSTMTSPPTISTEPNLSTGSNQFTKDQRMIYRSSDESLEKKKIHQNKGEEERVEEEEIVDRLIKRLRGSSKSIDNLKMIDHFKTLSSSKDKLEKVLKNEDEIMEDVLLRLGGLSFQKTIKKKKNNNNNNNNKPKKVEDQDSKTSLRGGSSEDNSGGEGRTVKTYEEDHGPKDCSEEERRLRIIKNEMMSSIYSKKLELSSNGKLLLPKSVRIREEQDQMILRLKHQKKDRRVVETFKKKPSNSILLTSDNNGDEFGGGCKVKYDDEDEKKKKKKKKNEEDCSVEEVVKNDYGIFLGQSLIIHRNSRSNSSRKVLNGPSNRIRERELLRLK